jgi:DNA polymerase V
VDCQSFYCSCERLFRPDLADKPVVVLSNNDGCLVSVTPEAKALGFRGGDPYFKVAAALKRAGAAAFSSNYTLYADLSRRVMATMQSLAPEIEQYSIDEAFVPFSEALAVQAEEVGWALHDRVRQWTGIPVRVGIGPTKTLAKLANHWAKKITRVLLLEPGSPQLEELLETTPVGDIWGIGRRLAARLEGQGCFTAKQLRDMPDKTAKKIFNVLGQRTVLELRGIQCIEEEAPTARKSLFNSRSFGQPVTEKEALKEALAYHCSIAGERLRSEGLTAGSLSIYLATSWHIEDSFQTGATIDLGGLQTTPWPLSGPPMTLWRDVLSSALNMPRLVSCSWTWGTRTAKPKTSLRRLKMNAARTSWPRWMKSIPNTAGGPLGSPPKVSPTLPGI